MTTGDIFKKSKLILLGVATSSMLLTSCATTSGPKTAVQSAIGKCAVSVGAGALLGAVIGNNSGSGNAKKGAVIGALAGSGVCGFLLYRASEEDKARIAELELEALNKPTVGTTRKQFTSTNGRDVFTVHTVTSEVSKEEYPEYDLVRVAEVTSNPTPPSAEMGESTPVSNHDNEIKTTSEWDMCRALNTNIESGGQVMQGKKRYSCRTKLGNWVNF